jgi:Dinucleotide-utilizing enzymes involved in molybdopterin and thiamine biosynthesis family 1
MVSVSQIFTGSEDESMGSFERTEILFGKDAVRRLQKARVAVFGIGGVGGYVAEALSRSAIGQLDLIDSDIIVRSNINRQIYATEKTIGRQKVDVAKERILEINPQAVVRTYPVFYLPETAAQFDFTQYDYVVDAIDTVTGKLMLAKQAKEASVPIISAMGAGNKRNSAMLEVADIYETSVCPLARVMRRELKKWGIDCLKVVYSKEKPITPQYVRVEELEEKTGKLPAGSNAFVPPAAGLMIAGEVVNDLLAEQE